MKNRNFRIITLVLAALLLIGGVVGISVAAEDAAPAPTVEIARKTISYEGAIKILYAIDVQNVAEDQTVKVYFYDTADTDVEPAYVKGLDEDDTITLNGVTYPIVFSNGFSPKNMRKSVFAKPVVENADGEVVAEGEILEYSIWQYAINQFSKDSITEDQRELYTALLDYGAALQKLLLGTDSYTEADLAAAGGYADEYYVLSVESVIDGETIATNYNTYSESDIQGYYTPAGVSANKALNGAIFCGFTDKNGNALTDYGTDKTASSWNEYNAVALKELCAKPGIVTVYANYEKIGKLYDFSNGLDGLSPGSNISIPEGEEYLLFRRVISPAKAPGAVTFNSNNKHGDVYVFETDITWHGYTAEETSTTWFAAIYLESDASAKVGSNNAIARYFINSTTDDKIQIKGDNGVTYKNGSTVIATIAKDVTTNLRIEYTPTGTNESGKHTHNVKLYVDGKLVSNYNGVVKVEKEGYTTFDNTTFNNVGINSRGNDKYTASCDFSIDNVICTTISNNANGFESTSPYYSNLKLDSSDVAANYSVVEDTINAGNKVFKADFTALNSSQSYDQHEVYLSNDYASTGKGIYEFSFDFRYDGITTMKGYLMDFIPQAISYGYFQQIYFAMDADGQLEITTTTLGSDNSNYESWGAGKGATLAKNIDINWSAWNNIKIVMEKNGTDGTYLTAYLNGVQIGDRCNTYQNASAPKPESDLYRLDWRIRKHAATLTDGVTTGGYTLYVDNLAFNYVCDIVD